MGPPIPLKDIPTRSGESDRWEEKRQDRERKKRAAGVTLTASHRWNSAVIAAKA